VLVKEDIYIPEEQRDELYPDISGVIPKGLANRNPNE
jgi:hypothetical protein